MQSTERQLYKCEVDINQEDKFDLEPLFKLDHAAVALRSTFVSGKEVTVAMTSNLRLYINEQLFSTECTSFLVTQNFLLLVNATGGLLH